MCIDFLVSAHPQVARSKVVLETAIHPFNHSSLSIALIRRMNKAGSVGRLAFSCNRFFQVLVSSWVRVNNADTAMLFLVIMDLHGVIGTVHAFVEKGDPLPCYVS